MDSLLQILTERAQDQPHKLAFDALGSTPRQITYSQLHQQVTRIGQALQDKLSAGCTVLLLFTDAIEFIQAFLGCQAAGMIPVPAYPPNPNRHRLGADLAKIELIAQDANVTCILTDNRCKKLLKYAKAHQLLHQARAFFSTATKPPVVDCLTLPTYLLEQLATHTTANHTLNPANEIALLQYTSGSTGDPKGVILTHHNIISNTRAIGDVVTKNNIEHLLTWLPLYHDLGLMNGVLLPIVLGLPCHILSPWDMLAHPVDWLKAIADYPNVMTGGPNFVFDLCLKRITPEQQATLDLRHWKIAYMGAERNQPHTIKQFGQRFQAQGFRSQSFITCYGLAESTTGICGVGIGNDDQCHFLHLERAALENHRIQPCQPTQTQSTELVSQGTWLKNHSLLVVNPDTRQICPADQIGEIWFQGPSVSPGYWRNPEASKTTFGAYTQDHQGPYLRTGDLGFVYDNQVYITGRIKDLIIMRGRNFSAADLEWSVQQAHAAIRKGCVCAFTLQDNPPSLIILLEINPGQHDHQEILSAIRANLSHTFSLKAQRIVLTPPKQLLKTTSGKIRRQPNKQAFMRRQLDTLLSQTDTLNIQIDANPDTLGQFFQST